MVLVYESQGFAYNRKSETSGREVLGFVIGFWLEYCMEDEGGDEEDGEHQDQIQTKKKMVLHGKK